jgi:hypothetical protein
MAHIEGPLEIRGPAQDGDYAIIAQIDGKPAIIGEAYRTVSEGIDTTAEDNARLWASAPDLLRQRDELAAELDRAIRLAESRRVGWEGAIAIQEALEKRADALATALAGKHSKFGNVPDTLDELARQIDYNSSNPGWSTLFAWAVLLRLMAEEQRAALARLPAEAGEAGEPALPGRPG